MGELKRKPQNRPITLKLTYSDGATHTKTFKSVIDANWYCHNEGDHLVKVEVVKYETVRSP